MPQYETKYLIVSFSNNLILIKIIENFFISFLTLKLNYIHK